MTVLQRNEPSTDGAGRPGPLERPRPLLVRATGLASAALVGAVCVLAGVVLVAVPVLVGWLADARSSASFWQTTGAAVDVWALAHRARVHMPGADLVLAPLLLTAVLAALCWYAATQVLLARPQVRGRVPTIGGWRGAFHALGGDVALAFVLGYLVAALLVGHTASFGLAPVALLTLVPGAVLVPALGLAAVWVLEHRREEHPGVAAGLRWLDVRMPVAVRRGLPAAGEVLVGLAAVSFLVAVGLVLLRGERVLALYSALDAGVVGTGVLTLAQLAALPNLMLWALSWLTGAGLQVGTVQVGWTGSTAGDLPFVPVLAALPEPGPMPPGLWALALVPLVAGAWVGHRAVEEGSRLSTWWSKAQVALVSAAVVGLAALLLGWLASGGLTPGLLGTVGVVPWRFAALLTAEVGVGALLAVTLAHLRGRRL